MSRSNWWVSWKVPLRAAVAVAAVPMVLALAGCPVVSSSSDSETVVPQTIIESNLNTQVAHIGGATVAVKYYADGSGEWVLYSMANRLGATRIGMTKDAVTEIDDLPGTIRNITVVPGKPIALLSMGEKGIGVVDITNPAAMKYLGTWSVDYTTPDIDYSDGGGNHLTAPSAEHTNGYISDLLVYNDGTDDQLLIADKSFGIQKTKLSNLLDAAPGSAITIDGAQTWTLKYAGENPWGGPLSLKMHDGKLYVVLEFLGIGIYDPADLTRLASYNLYADSTTREDWFGYQHEKAVDVLSGEYIDADGMPTWQEASRELMSNRDNTTLAHYPWARFDRYGKYYYNARSVDVVDLPNGRTMAYIAYGLGGLVAVDVTGQPTYAGYVPVPPAHGPDEPTGTSSKSILSHHGSGMLAEAGAQDVRVVADPGGNGAYDAYFSDHFAGLVVVSGAGNPAANWHGPKGKGKYNNDTNPEAYWPDYEFVTSYDMTPVPVGEESLPKFLVDNGGNYDSPVLLATGEINGHGGAMFVMPNANFAAAGQVDLVQSAGAGGVSFVDITDLATPGVAVASRFAVPVHLASTNEIGAAPPGEPTEVAIGHSEGLAVNGNHLFLADGPHGMSVWRIANGVGNPIDDIHLVANTVMDEYPLDGVLPTPHAHGVLFGEDPTKAYVLSQSMGLRRVDVSGVGGAQPGTPLLLTPSLSDFYEHSTEGSGNLGGIHGQDHAYGGLIYGKYAIVADGSNGITVYDTTVPADTTTGAAIVANLGGTVTGKAPLGRAASLRLWKDPSTGRIYAVVAAGAYGISVVDMTDLLVSGIRPGMTLLKTFEPIKIEEEDEEIHVGSADGKSVDVQIANGIAYVSYDSFGLVAYRMSDLIQPLADYQPPGQPAGVCAGVDPTQLFTPHGGVDCRPVAVGHFNLDDVGPAYAALEGGAEYMTAQYFPANQPISDGAGRIYKLTSPRVLLYVAYGDAGVIKLDWSDPANPVLLQHQDTAGDALATAIANGRVYVADYDGGLVVFK